MKILFADPFYWSALLNSKDEWDDKLEEVDRASEQDVIVTSEEVLTELLEFFSSYNASARQAAVSLVHHILQHPNVQPRLDTIAARFQTANQADTLAKVLDLAESALAAARLLETTPENLETALSSFLARLQQLQQEKKVELKAQNDLAQQPESNVNFNVLNLAVACLDRRLSAIETQLSAKTVPFVSSTKQSFIEQSRSADPSLSSAREKIDRAVKAVMEFNDRCSEKSQKWAVNASAIARLTGCNRPAIRRYFEENQSLVDEHNTRHGLSQRHNTAKGRQGIQIEGAIVW
jgi:hypothetical protein